MKDLFVNTQLPVVTSDRILYTPSNFARTSLLYLQEIGSLQVHKPHSTTLLESLASTRCMNRWDEGSWDRISLDTEGSPS